MVKERELTHTNYQGDLKFVLLISSVAAIGGFLFGFDSAVINGTVNALARAFNSQAAVTGFAVASVLLGSAVGAFFAGRIADNFGRKTTMIVASILFLISAIGSGIAFNPWDFTIYRLIGGFAVGAASVIAPAYIAEVSPAHLRGRLGSLQQMAIVVGIFAAFVSNYIIAQAAGSADAPFWFNVPAWRWMFWVEAIPAVAYGVGAFYIPESPRYLVAIGRRAEAAAILSRVEGGNVENQVEEIHQTVLTERKPRMSDLLNRNGQVLKIVWIGMGLSVFQQFVGINVIFYYGAVLWQAAGLSERDSLTINVITAIVNIVSTIIAILLIDKIGRKPLLIFGSVGMTIALGIMTVIFKGAGVDAAGKLALGGTPALISLIAANAYVFCFGVSWGPVVWVMLGEMFNNKIRAAALAVGAAIQWVANFLITLTFPILLDNFGLSSAYGLYTIMAAISLFFVYLLVKETRGITLEKM